MKTNNNHNHIKRTFAAAATAAMLLGTLASVRLPARADEFTVGHSGADVAFSQYGLDGSGVTVAVLDTGVKAVNDLYSATNRASQIIGAVNFGSGKWPDDLCGHGTHVAGIVAGNGTVSAGSGCYRT